MKIKISPIWALVLLYTLAIYGPLAAVNIATGILVAGWLFIARKEAWEDLEKAWRSPLFWPTVAFGAACLLSLVWAEVSDLKFLGMQSEVRWLDDPRKLWHLLRIVLLAAIFTRLTDNELLGTVKTWMVAGLVVAVMGIVQHYIPIYRPLALPDDGLKGYYHATGFYAFHLSYASVLAFPTCAWFGMVAISLRKRERRSKTLLLFLASVVFVLANIFTYSKITWLSVPLSIVLLAFVGFKGWPRYALLAMIVTLCIVWGSSEEVRLRFHGTDTIKERVEVWNANVEMIKAHPILGVGWHHNGGLAKAFYDSRGMRGFISHAHNNVLDQWASTGIVGLAAFLWWSAAVIWMAYLVYRRTPGFYIPALGLGLVGGWFCLHVNGLTQCNFWDPKVLHQITWVAAMTMALYARARSRSSSRSSKDLRLSNLPKTK